MTAQTRAARRVTSALQASWAGCVVTRSASHPSSGCRGTGSRACVVRADRCVGSGIPWVREDPRGRALPHSVGSAAETGRRGQGAAPG